MTYSGCSRQQTHSLCVGMVAHLSQVHHRAFSNRSFNSTWLLSPAESLARSGFKSSHTKAQKNKHTLGRNDVTDMRPGLQDPFKMATPSVEVFTSFSLGSHSLQKLKQRWVTQLTVNFLLAMGKNTRFLEWPSPLINCSNWETLMGCLLEVWWVKRRCAAARTSSPTVALIEMVPRRTLSEKAS